MNPYFYFLILITAILTIKTDISEKKIYNSHLSLVGILTLLGYLVVLTSQKSPISFNNFIINLTLSLSIGFAFYLKDMWRAGDAKLFFIYSLLIATKETNPVIPIPCIELFFNMFLLGGLFLVPSIAITTVRKRNTLLTNITIKKIIYSIIKTFMVTLGLSWLVFPILHVFEIKGGIFINSLILYLSFRLLYKFFSLIKNRTIFILVFLAGFILRFILIPKSLNIYQLFNYLKLIIIFSIIYYPAKIFIESEKEKTNRVPYAPFMFLGAVLSYTGFLNFCMHIINAATR